MLQRAVTDVLKTNEKLENLTKDIEKKKESKDNIK